MTADPAGLFARIATPGQPTTGNARIYRYAYRDLRSGADAAGRRASYLELAARRNRAPLTDQLEHLPLHRPWTARWIRGGQKSCPHYIVGRHDDGVTAVAVGAVRHGRPVIVSGSWDGTVRVELIRRPGASPAGGEMISTVAVAVPARKADSGQLGCRDRGDAAADDIEQNSSAAVLVDGCGPVRERGIDVCESHRQSPSGSSASELLVFQGK